jgi:hypothetical protein
MSSIGPGIITVIVSVIGLAMVAVLVSNQAQTGQVINQSGTALSNIIKAAVAPVSGGNNLFGALSSSSYGSTLGNMLGSGGL